MNIDIIDDIIKTKLQTEIDDLSLARDKDDKERTAYIEGKIYAYENIEGIIRRLRS